MRAGAISPDVDRLFFALGSIIGLLSVAAGAFGAHALRDQLDAKSLSIFETSARYQMFHALALIAVAVAAERWPSPAVRVAGWAFVVGVVIFCGTLYLLAFGAPNFFGMITPVGGLAFLIGWGSLAVAALRG